MIVAALAAQPFMYLSGMVSAAIIKYLLMIVLHHI
jgi:hypothetical protein